MVLGEEREDQGRGGGDSDGAVDGGEDRVVADRGPSALPADISNALSELETPRITFHSLSAPSHFNSPFKELKIWSQIAAFNSDSEAVSSLAFSVILVLFGCPSFSEI